MRALLGFLRRRAGFSSVPDRGGCDVRLRNASGSVGLRLRFLDCVVSRTQWLCVDGFAFQVASTWKGDGMPSNAMSRPIIQPCYVMASHVLACHVMAKGRVTVSPRPAMSFHVLSRMLRSRAIAWLVFSFICQIDSRHVSSTDFTSCRELSSVKR